MLINKKSISQKRRWLIINDKDSKIENGNYPIAHGCGFKIKEHDLYHDNINGQDTLFTLQNGIKVILYPNYSAMDQIQIAGSKIKIKIWQVVSDIDWLKGQDLISKTHYLNQTNRGMMIACKFEDNDEEEKFINKYVIDKVNKLKTNIHYFKGEMVGCAILDTLIFGKPTGRRAFAESILGEDWEKKGRNEIVKSLGLAWGSRFAVQEPFQGLGLGTLLAEHLKFIAKNYRVPPAKRIEVIRTVTKEKANKIINNEESDFLLRAGYSVYPKPTYTQPIWEMDYKSGLKLPPTQGNERKVYNKLYYYTDI